MREFDKIIGYGPIKQELEMYCDVLKNTEKYKKLGVVIPSGILLDGQPGLGKTLMAKCFIAESGCKAYTVRKEKPNGDFVKEIKTIYGKAKSDGKAIVFLDDMDKFANEDQDHPNAEEYVTVQSCIDDCKENDVLTIATINDRTLLPESLIRAGRFDKIIEVSEPYGDDFNEIIRHFLSTKKVSKNLDFEEIARLMDKNSCATLERIINDAGIYAAYAGREMIEQQDLVKSCIRELFETSDASSIAGTESKQKKAIHEAGHALVSEILMPDSVNAISVKGCNGSTGGITTYRKECADEQSIFLLEVRAMRALAGKAATEIVLGIADSGCREDMINACNNIKMILDDLCTYGFDSFYTRTYWSTDCESNLHSRIQHETERLYAKAKRIIVENRAFLEAIVEALLEKDTLTFRDIQKIKSAIYP